jgi:polyisoprenyl-phosphate glycosyltransferase
MVGPRRASDVSNPPHHVSSHLLKPEAPLTHSVVVPVYGNEATLPELLVQLTQVHRDCPGELEVIFVIDGSPDNSHALLALQLPAMPFPSQLIALSRNFGAFAAVRAGLAAARGEHIAVLAADLQQPVSSVGQMFAVLEGGSDIAIGQRSSRDDPWFSRVASQAFWRVYRRYVQPQMSPGGIDSFACSRRVRDILVGLPEANSTLLGLLFWIGFRRQTVTYPRAARKAGRSGWRFRRKVRYAFDSIFAFSDLPLTLMMIAGVLGVSGALLAGAAVFIGWAAGAIPVPGYTPLMLAVLLSFSTTLLALGLIGGYVWRIFENTKGRPMHLVQSAERFEPAGGSPRANAVAGQLSRPGPGGTC